MSNMFEGSQHIHTIRVSDNFVVTNVTNSSSMFGNCYRLVGSAGTFFDSNYTDKNRAHYDGGSSNPGYFTRENEVTGIFLYNADYNPGTFALGIVTTTCTITSGDSCTLSVPSVVSSSVGKYNSPYKGVADSEIEMNLTSLTVSETKYFLAVYSAPVTVYYYESGYTSATIYRNEYFNQNDEIVSVLSISETGVSNAYVYSGPNGSSFAGISTAQDTTIEYNTVADAANSVSDTVYLVYKYTVNYQIGANVSAIGSTSSSCNITTNDTSCSIVLPSITPNSGYTSVGWSTINGDTTGTPALSLVTINANNITVYANATR